MEKAPSPPQNLLLPAIFFEGLIAVLAIVACWIQGRWPLSTFHWNPLDAVWSVLATVPLLGGVAVAIRYPHGPFGRLMEVLDRYVLPLFEQCKLIDLVLIAILAGLGEEMLFRVVIQQWMSLHIGGPTGMWIGLLASAALFGSAHWVTPMYGIVAGLIGLYLGALWLLTGSLLVPIGTHALYDFLVLAYLVRKRKGLELSA